MKKTILLLTGLVFLTFKNQAQTTVTDYDGNVYNILKIGTQLWLKENLKVTHFRNGVAIPNVTDDMEWSNLTTAAYCDYYNIGSNSDIYGRLYNWYVAIDTNNICPTDWHVPSDGEWNILEKFVDSTTDTTATGYVGTDLGGKLKEIGSMHWLSPNTGATDSLGFSALPGGYRFYTGEFNYLWETGSWWTTRVYNGTSAWERDLYYNYAQVYRSADNIGDGMSIRCVRKGYGIGIENINFQEKSNIYPNPAFDRVYINYTKTKSAKMQIYNIIGKCVLLGQLNYGINNIDVSSLSKGIYLLKMTGTDWTEERKLTKE
jgi:uncharacterized protein (TIGR02145 family)